MRLKAMLAFIAYTAATLGMLALLTGCETGRALYHACKDGHCR